MGEDKRKHLEFIQAVITRMAGNAFLLKGWSVTLVAALFALAAKDARLEFTLAAYIPVFAFWILDGYFLSQERMYRALYDEVRQRQEGSIDFSMNAGGFNTGKSTWGYSFWSTTLRWFNIPLLGMMILVTLMLCLLRRA